MAAYKGDSPLVKALLKGGADANAENKDGMGPLMCAAQNGHLEIVKTLILAGADVKAKTNVHNTALMLAAAGMHCEVVKVLVEAGSDINAADVDGNVVLQAAAKCDASILQMFLDRRVNLHIGKPAGDAILSNLLLSGRTENVRLLLSHGAKLKWNTETLIVLASHGYLDAMELLLEHGANINAKEPLHGLTPLLAAAAYGKLLMVNLLIKNGADRRATDKYGNSAQTLAQMQQRTETVAYLQSLTADTQIQVDTQNGGKPKYSLGSQGPGGGIVFWVDDTGFHGWEAYPKDSGEMAWPNAFKISSELGDGWHLPTLDELQHLYQHKNLVGGFRDGFYWSSTQHRADTTWHAVVFSNGNSMPLRKYGDACYVRAVRAF